MEKKVKLVCGWGINDANYTVTKTVNGKRVHCPFHKAWHGMLQRTNSRTLKDKHPTYENCYAVPEWKYFMNFRSWMMTQDWEGKQLDKDLLVEGNKVYGPDTCVFVSQRVNLFMLERENKRGEWPLGVGFNKRQGTFVAMCRGGEGANQYIGSFGCPNEAHLAYKKRKAQYAAELAAEQTDPRVSKALLDRYCNNVHYTV